MLRFLGSSGRDSIGRGQHSSNRHLHQDNAPVHNSILVTDYLTKMGIKTVPHPPYSPDLAPCDFWLFSKLRGCCYETIEEMKEAVMKVIDTLKQEDFHGALQKLLERYNKCIAAGGNYFEGDQSFMCVGPGDLGSIPGRVIPKTLKMELDTTLLNTQHYKVRFKGKVEQSWEWSSALPYTLVQQLSKREPSGHPRLWSLTLLFTINKGAHTKKVWKLIECTSYIIFFKS